MLSIILAFLTSCAFSLPYELLDTAEIGILMPSGSLIEKVTAFITVTAERMFPQAILFFLLFLFLFHIMLCRIRRKHFSPAALAAAALFSFYLLAGECAVLTGDLGVLLRTGPQCMFTALKVYGYLALIYVAVRFGFALLDERTEQPVSGRFSFRFLKITALYSRF